MRDNNLEPHNVKAITRSFELIFETQDIGHLTKVAYTFSHLYLGFIAHYNHHTFMDTYRDDLKTFTETITQADVSRYKEDKWFTNEYGEAYCKSIYDIGTAVIAKAKEALTEITIRQYQAERDSAIDHINLLKRKYNI